MIAKHVDGATIEVKESNDPRSYRVNSDRLLATGFRPKKGVEDAIKELVGLYRQGAWTDDQSFYRMKWMQQEVLN
jgi:hypothetical protein